MVRRGGFVIGEHADLSISRMGVGPMVRPQQNLDYDRRMSGREGLVAGGPPAEIFRQRTSRENRGMLA